tara:strand:- start:475 stop:831 length:357 start_codon:yes stop_codon:yes gene_type:complete
MLYLCGMNNAKNNKMSTQNTQNTQNQQVMTSLTEKEKVVIDIMLSFLRSDIGYDSFYDIEMKDIVEDTGIASNSLKGVLGSLIKKGILACDGDLYDVSMFGFENQENLTVEEVENWIK